MTPDSIPALRRGVRRHFDQTRNTAVLMAPERVVVLDEIGDAIIGQCDGSSRLSEIAARLAARYNMPEAEITPDIVDFLEELAEAALVTL